MFRGWASFWTLDFSTSVAPQLGSCASVVPQSCASKLCLKVGPIHLAKKYLVKLRPWVWKYSSYILDAHLVD